MEKLNLESPRFTSRAAFLDFSLAMYLARSRHLSKMIGGNAGVNEDMIEPSDHDVVGEIQANSEPEALKKAQDIHNPQDGNTPHHSEARVVGIDGEPYYEEDE